eukprot:TRINITY_DN486_c0_g3_i1.p6 TRINITY_DN486_c0_g3~~TRINITY_DN486_c0_g3_i1.p6  ORF type:complete len:119 (+),score=8.64 TRINITY_DN486_c0_g3_i1:216-572(+)
MLESRCNWLSLHLERGKTRCTRSAFWRRFSTSSHNHSHPNIIGYKEAFFEDATRSLCIVMEFAGGGDLLKKVNVHSKNGTHFSESEIWHMFIQMVAGLKVLHGMKILHRDIKVEFYTL